MTSRRHLPRVQSLRRQAGVTLVESLIVLAVTAVGLGSVLPNFGQLRERRQVEGAAAQLATDIHFVRSLVVLHNRNLRMSFDARGNGSCYVIHSGRAGDCTCSASGAAPVCSAAATVYRNVAFTPGSGVQLAANVRSIVFDADQGTSTPAATLRVTAPGGSVHQVVSIMGRVRSCTPDRVPGYPAC